MVTRWARPPRREANHEGMLRSGVPRGRRNITQVWMVLRRARPPRSEANHDGRLRSGVPRGGVTYPRSDWFCAGPGLLGERQITTACCYVSAQSIICALGLRTEEGGRSGRRSALFKTSTQPQEGWEKTEFPYTDKIPKAPQPLNPGRRPPAPPLIAACRGDCPLS